MEIHKKKIRNDSNERNAADKPPGERN